jgi:transforming growth factor-beta-induced protein
MKKITRTIAKLSMAFSFFLYGSMSYAQTSVYDVISGSANHTTLTAAINAAGLDGALDDLNEEYTVFAPDDAAFTDALNELGLTPAQLLASADLSDILLYHVLSGTTVNSGDVTNGGLPTPMNTANTLKTTLDGGSVFINQAQVNAPDLGADNGVVHSLDAVLFADETVADIAIDSPNHTTLVAAVIEARLLPALTDPFANLTVFGPTDDAFTAALGELGLTPAQLLASPDLEDILLYHVLGTEEAAADLSNGQLAQPLSTSNTLKVTVAGSGDVFVNQATVTGADNFAENGVVHILDEVVFSDQTVVDIAIGSPDHTSLVAAVIEAELLPALTDPFEEYTVFAPTDQAFDDAAADLGVTVNDILALSFLDNILLYHVVSGTVLSTDLTNGPVTTLNTEDVVVDLSSGVMINQANVTTADLTADNGVVHVIDAVLQPEVLSIEDEMSLETLVAYPNPTKDVLNVTNVEGASYKVVSITGAVVKEGIVTNGNIDVQNLNEGTYMINIQNNEKIYQGRFVKM